MRYICEYCQQIWNKQDLDDQNELMCPECFEQLKKYRGKNDSDDYDDQQIDQQDQNYDDYDDNYDDEEDDDYDYKSDYRKQNSMNDYNSHDYQDDLYEDD